MLYFFMVSKSAYHDEENTNTSFNKIKFRDLMLKTVFDIDLPMLCQFLV